MKILLMIMRLLFFLNVYVTLSICLVRADKINLSNRDFQSLVYGVITKDLSEVDLIIPSANVREFNFTSGQHLIVPVKKANEMYQFSVITKNLNGKKLEFLFKLTTFPFKKSTNKNFFNHLQKHGIEQFVIIKFETGKNPQVIAIRSDRELKVFPIKDKIE